VIPKVLNPKVHGIIDYAIAGTLIAGPYLFGFNKKDKLATKLSIAQGISVLSLSLLTRYPLGVFKVVPFPVHGIIETSAASLLTLSPYLFNYRTGRATNFHLFTGIGTLSLAALTNYKATISKKADKTVTEKDRVAA
jgi:hypothetical protein